MYYLLHLIFTLIGLLRVQELQKTMRQESNLFQLDAYCQIHAKHQSVNFKQRANALQRGLSDSDNNVIITLTDVLTDITQEAGCSPTQIHLIYFYLAVMCIFAIC